MVSKQIPKGSIYLSMYYEELEEATSQSALEQAEVHLERVWFVLLSDPDFSLDIWQRFSLIMG